MTFVLPAGVPARRIRVAVLRAASPSDLPTQVDTWRRAAGERSLLAVHTVVAGTELIAVLWYTEG